MKVHYLTRKPTEQQVSEMLEAHGEFIKLAVDLKLRVVAGGGEMHADCEEVLLEEGSAQEDIWGGDWMLSANRVRFQSFINLRPRQGNRSMYLDSPDRRAVFEEIVREVFGAGPAEAERTDRVSDKRARYLRDPLPVRLGNLASSLARLSDFAQFEGEEAVYRLLRECASFVEWAGPEADPALQPDLEQLQRALIRWTDDWSAEAPRPGTRLELCGFAKEQSDRVLDWSGVLAEV